MVIISDNSKVINCTGDFVVKINQIIDEYRLDIILPNIPKATTLGTTIGIFSSAEKANNQLNALAVAIANGDKIYRINAE